jgi:glycerophosphoryl diester phosphodiesterase
LEDVLRGFSHRAYLDIELKAPGNDASVLAALRENRPQRGFLVSSFYPEILTRLRALDPGLPLGFIFDRQEAMAIWREMPVQVLLPERELINPVLIDEAHYRGLQIMCWTVNRRADMLRIADLLIDGLISDDPQVLYQTFQSR